MLAGLSGVGKSSLLQAVQPGLRLLGRIGVLSVHQYAYDLSVDDLATEEAKFTSAMRTLL